MSIYWFQWNYSWKRGSTSTKKIHIVRPRNKKFKGRRWVYSGNMLPPICVKYDFDRWPLFFIFNLQKPNVNLQFHITAKNKLLNVSLLFQTFSGCSLTVCMTRTSSRRTLSTSGSRAKTPPSSMVRVWPSSPSRPSSPGCGRRKRSRKTIDEGDIRGTWRRVRTAFLRQTKHSKWMCGQDDMFTAGIFFCGTVLKHAAILSLDSNGGSTKYLYYT